MMSEPSSLLLEFLGWISRHPRTYAEAMEAWRSTCPRLTVWEDALAEGLIRIESRGTMRQSAVLLTAYGRTLLDGAPAPVPKG